MKAARPPAWKQSVTLPALTARERGTAFRPGNLPIDGLILALVVVWPILLYVAVWRPETPHDAFRALVAVLCGAAATLPFDVRHRRLLISPLFLLGIISTVFYALVPWLTVLPETDSWFGRSRLPDFWAPVVRFTAQRGEMLVLQFSAAALLAALIFHRLGASQAPVTVKTGPPIARDKNARAVAAIAGSAIGVCSAILFVHALWPGGVAWLSTGAGREAINGIAPLTSICAVAIFAAAAGRTRKWHAWAFAALLVGCAALVTTHAAKASAHIAFATLAYFVVFARPSRRNVVLVSVLGAAVLIASLQVATILRAPDLFGKSRSDFAVMVIKAKLFIRQSVTAACFENATQASLPAGQGETPLYFLDILVPRLFWPEKPSFSLGNQYARAYCYGTPSKEQSSSITLLGQPIVRAGWRGLFVAQTTLIAGLALFTWLAMRIPPAGPIAIAALLPWLIDFDQSFALYVGNGVKHFLWMLPVAIAIHVVAGRRTAEGDSVT